MATRTTTVKTSGTLKNETAKKSVLAASMTDSGLMMTTTSAQSAAPEAKAGVLASNKFAYTIMADLNHLAKYAYMGGQYNDMGGPAQDQSDAALKARVEQGGWNMMFTKEDGNAFGFVVNRTEGGLRELALSFRGTTDVVDIINYDVQLSLTGGLFSSYYAKLASMVDYAIAHAGEYDQIYVTGHSLGAGAAQLAFEALAKAGISYDKLVGAGIGTPGLGIDLLNKHGDYSDALFLMQQKGYVTGDPVTLVPGHIGQRMDINFTPDLHAFYEAAFAPDQFADKAVWALDYMKLHAQYMYIESTVHMAYGDRNIDAASTAQLKEVYLRGGSGNDLVRGSEGADTLTGGDGHDILVGGGGNDTLIDRSGRNTFVYTDMGTTLTVLGGVGDRVLLPFGVTPDQVLYTVKGNDLVLTLSHGVDGQVIIKDWASNPAAHVGKIGFVQTDHYGMMEQAFVDISKLPGTSGSLGGKVTMLDTPHDLMAGSSGANRLDGGEGSDRLYGHGGNDTLSGGRNSDWLEGGSGNDTLDGGTEKDFLYGGSGNDILIGGAGEDLLYGGSGNDRLTGGAGKDQLTGGTGKDVFVINSLDEIDQIKDLNFAEGDVLDLSALFGTRDVHAGNVTKYVDFKTSLFGSDSTVRIDLDGKGGGLFQTGWDKDVVVLEGLKLDDDDLQHYANLGQIIV